MAAVRRFPNSRYWYACYNVPLPSGQLKRVQTSTRQTDRDTALQMAISYEQAARLAAAKRWTEKAAMSFVRKLSVIAGVDMPQVEPAGDYLARWIASQKSALSERSHETYKRAVDGFTAFLGDKAKAPLGEITPSTVAAFRNEETAKGKGPSTVNLVLGVLAKAFDEAVTLGIFERNPARRLNVGGVKRSTQKRSPFTFEQFRLVLGRCREAAKEGSDLEWETLCYLAAYTAGRRGELVKCEAAGVDLEGKRIALDRTKTNDTHWLPLHPALEKHLRSLAIKSGPLMPVIASKIPRYISKEFRRVILKPLGLHREYEKRSGPGVGRAISPLTLHSFRHSLSTWLLQAGVDENVRMDLIGHADRDVNRGYTHSSFDQARAALAKVPSV